MGLQFKEQKNGVTMPDRLSISRNFERTTTNTNTRQKEPMKNSYIQKMKLKIYISSDNRKFIEKSAAYSLGLTGVRAIMVENQLNFFEISDVQLEALKSRNIEMEYCQVPDEMVPKKPSIKVFQQGVNYFIEPSAAYALGLITDKNFYALGNQLYQVSDNLLAFLNNKRSVLVCA